MPKKKPGMYKAKNGATYEILKSGKAVFRSGPTKGRGAKKKKPSGGGVASGGGIRTAGGLKKKKY